MREKGLQQQQIEDKMFSEEKIKMLKEIEITKSQPTN